MASTCRLRDHANNRQIKLLNLVPRFRQTLENRIWGTNKIEILVNFMESNTGPAMVDHHNPAIKVVLQG